MRLIIASSLAVFALLGSMPAHAETWAFAFVEGASSPELRAIVGKALRKKDKGVRDFTDAYRSIDGPLSLLKLDAAAPTILSEKLQADWKTGTATCRARAGEGPYTMRNKAAFLSTPELKTALWQRLLDEAAPSMVVEFHLREDREGRWDIRAVTFPVNSKETWESSEKKVPAKERNAALTRVAQKALTKKGVGGSRWVHRDLPLAPLEDPILVGGAVQYADPVEIPETCVGALPAKLSVGPAESPVADSVIQSWASSVRTSGLKMGQETWKCEVMAYQVRSAMMSSLQSVQGELRCTEGSFFATSVTISPTSPSTRLKLVKGLMKSLVKKTCNPRPSRRRR